MSRRAASLVVVALAAAAGFASSSCSLDLSTTSGAVMIRGRAMKGLRTHQPVQGYVQLVRPAGSSSTAWSQYTYGTTSGVPNKVQTDEDGYFTFWVEEDVFEFSAESTFFLSFTSSTDDTYSLLAPIASDLLVQDGTIDLDISPESTLASLMICPGGKYPAPSGSYCYEQVTEQRYTETLVEITESLEGSANGSLTLADTNPDWSAFATQFLNNDSAAFTYFEAWIEVTFEIEFTVTVVTSSLQEPPTVTEPTSDDLNDPDSAEEESSGDGECFPGHTTISCSFGGTRCCPDGTACCTYFDVEGCWSPGACD